MVVLDADIRFLVRQTLGHILLVLRIVGQFIVHAIAGIVVVQHLFDGILAHDATVAVVDVVVKHRHHIQRGVILLEELVVGNGLGDVLRGQHGMELAVLAQLPTTLHDVVGHHQVVLVTLVDVLGQIGLYAPHRPAILRVALRHLELVDKAVVYLGQFFILVDELQIFLHCLFRDNYFRIALFELQVDLMESHQFAQLVIIVGVHHVGVKAQHIAVGDATGNRVFVQHVAKECLGGNLVLGILFKHRCTCESEE